MTAGELKAKLAEYPDNMPVVLSRDSEGNAHADGRGASPRTVRRDVGVSE